MRVVHVDNSNVESSDIGGIVSYIRDATSSNPEFDFLFVGSGMPQFQNFIQVTKTPRNNIIFFLKLFITQFRLPNDKNTIYHFHKAYMRVPFIFIRKSKFILTLHGYSHKSIQDRKNPVIYRFYEFVTKRLMNSFDGFISDSDELFKFYMKRYDIKYGEQTNIPVCVDLNFFKKSNKTLLRKKLNLVVEEKIILFVGRVAYEKNLELLLDSFEICNTKYNKNYKLFIGGDGFVLPAIKKKAEELRSSSNIVFLGRLSKLEVVDYMNISDVFAITSLHEGGPIVLKEALSCNLKVVSVPVGDTSNVIPNFPGSILSTYNPEEFALSLIEALSKETPDYSENIKIFSKEHFQNDINNFYNKILY